MKRQLSILDSHTSVALMTTAHNTAPLYAHYAIQVSDTLWSRVSKRKASEMLFTILFILCFGFALAPPAAAQQYQVSYLDSLGGTNSRGDSINNRGWIAGFSRLSGDQNRHATLWRDGSPLDLGTLAGPVRNSSLVWHVKNERGILFESSGI